MNKKLEELNDECFAYIRFDKKIHPSRVKEMLKEAFEAGKEEARNEYPPKPTQPCDCLDWRDLQPSPFCSKCGGKGSINGK